MRRTKQKISNDEIRVIVKYCKMEAPYKRIVGELELQCGTVRKHRTISDKYNKILNDRKHWIWGETAHPSRIISESVRPNDENYTTIGKTAITKALVAFGKRAKPLEFGKYILDGKRVSLGELLETAAYERLNVRI